MAAKKQRSAKIWRCLFLGLAALGGVGMIPAVRAKLLLFCMGASVPQTRSASIGIIGGADGPTAIFVTSRTDGSFLVPLVLLLVGILGFAVLFARKRK